MSRASFSDDSRMIKKPLPKSLLLRDYLLDDMSSCSSNGFRSYPRRQCCTKVRFLVESDLNKAAKMYSKQHRRTSNLKPKQASMLQKASTVMIKAFKHLPFAGAGAGVPVKAKLLPRSLSRKLLKRGFWKKTDHHNNNNNEVKRLITFGELIKQKEITSSPSRLRLSTAITTITTAELTSSTINSNSNSNSNSSGNNGFTSDFTATSESFTSGNSSEVNVAQNDVVDELPEKKKTNGMRVGVTTATVTVTNYSDTAEDAKKWQDNQDEQFSPVSVMDFPTDNDDDDEEDEVSSMSSSKHVNVKGTKISMRKTRVSERAPQLEPVKLEDRIAQSVIECTTTTFLDSAQENQVEKKAMALLQLLKSTVSSHHLSKYEAMESLLLGFLEESLIEENVSNYRMLQRAKKWMDGQEEDIVIDWECEYNRQTYLKEMEKGVKWSNYDHQVEKVNVGLEVECEIFDSLVNDVLTEFNLQELDHED